MRKIILFLIIFLTCACSNSKNENLLTFKKDIFKYGEKVFLSDVIVNNNEYEISYKNDKIDTFQLGSFRLRIDYNIGKKRRYQYFNYEVIDDEKPIVWLNNSISRNVGYEKNITEEILCIDNADRNPKCEIIGDYNTNSVGSYNLVFKATDESGNIETKDFQLIIKENSSNKNQSKTYTHIEDVIKKYKNDKTMIGIDVSKYQGEIDWKKVKETGVEFAIIRLGYQYYFNEELSLDPYFIDNINNALDNDIKVGIYFYSYAISEEDASMQANFVIDNIKDYKIDMPIAFDWENFGHFNEISLNLYDLRSISNTFQKTIKKAGYKPVHYASKNYLKAFWLPLDYDTWLAHYIDQTNYDEKFIMWQMCNDGIVPGINGYVDIDIYYK